MHDKIRASFRWLLVWLLVISIENVLTNLDNTVETPPVRAKLFFTASNSLLLREEF